MHVQAQNRAGATLNEQSGTIRITGHPNIPAYKCDIKVANLHGLALIDGGATTSFISQLLAEQVSDLIQPLKSPVQVQNAGGPGFPLTHFLIGNMTICGRVVTPVHTFYLMPDNNPPIILGADWIELAQPQYNHSVWTLDIPAPEARQTLRVPASTTHYKFISAERLLQLAEAGEPI